LQALFLSHQWINRTLTFQSRKGRTFPAVQISGSIDQNMAPIIDLTIGGLDFDGVCREPLAIGAKTIPSFRQ